MKLCEKTSARKDEVVKVVAVGPRSQRYQRCGVRWLDPCGRQLSLQQLLTASPLGPASPARVWVLWVDNWWIDFVGFWPFLTGHCDENCSWIERRSVQTPPSWLVGFTRSYQQTTATRIMLLMSKTAQALDGSQPLRSRLHSDQCCRFFFPHASRKLEKNRNVMNSYSISWHLCQTTLN